MLVVPAEFNRNSVNVTSLMTPEQSGIWLLERMRQHIGFETYANKKVLDFGCGVRFSQAIINTDYPFGTYCGLNVFRPMIEFLQNMSPIGGSNTTSSTPTMPCTIRMARCSRRSRLYQSPSETSISSACSR